jgi:glycosyltransferase involved in cell wall biosynthesis
MEEFASTVGVSSWVEWCGPLTGPPLQSALRDAAAVVVPSIWEEAAPLTILEQMMAGRLLIVSDHGGQAEEVGDTGLKFAPGDAAGLAERMKEALTDPERAKQLGAMARARAIQMYSQDGMVRGHLKLYRTLLRDPTPVHET